MIKLTPLVRVPLGHGDACLRFASPKALEEGNADAVSGSGESPTFDGTFGYENPVGTGAFKFESWERGSQVTLTRYDDYWGEPAQLDELIFSVIPDGPARRQALEAGDIDGYDLVDPADVQALEDAGFQILRRPAFNVGYIGFQQNVAPFDNLQIRQAIAHAINKENLIQTNYPEGTVVATQFMPPELFGWADDVTTYDYNPDEARRLIAASGVTNLTLPFWYPTDVSRPYMPNPQANWELIKADLEAVGFTIEPHTAPWNPDYLDATQTGGTPMFLLGWTGDFGDPDNFIGTFFQDVNPQFGSFRIRTSSTSSTRRSGDRPSTARRALPGGQPADHGLLARCAVRPQRASCRIRRGRLRVRAGSAEQRELRPVTLS